MGVPLVGTAVGGLPELVGDAAILIAAGDVDALDAAVTALLDDPRLRADLGRRSSEQAATWPTEADTCREVAAVYTELLTRRTAGHPAPGAG